MTRKDQTDQLFARVATIMTLTDKFSNTGDLWDNFVDSIGSKGKNYDSVIDFIIDLLFEFGITKEYIINKLIEYIFDIPNASDLRGKIDSLDINEKPEWLNNVENAVKIVISDILTSILSCSVNPFIPEYMKEYGDGMIVSTTLIDPNYMLQINPSSSRGHCYYNVKDYSDSGEYLDRNNLFMSMDLNAFIWYSLRVAWNDNRWVNTWDTRRTSKSVNPNYRKTFGDWTDFINQDLDSDNPWYEDTNDGSGTTVKNVLRPIMRVSKYGSTGTLINIHIDDDYDTIYKFNHDYLNNIELFEPKILLTALLNSLIGATGSFAVGALSSINVVKKYIETLVEKAVINSIERDDYTVSDCYYDFDNELWADMLAKMELEKYGGQNGNNAENNLIDSINNAYSVKSTGSTYSNLQSLMYDVISEQRVTYGNVSYGLDINSKWLKEVLMRLIMPFVTAVLSPQVLLLFVINLEAMGLVRGFNDPSLNKVMSFIFGKIFSMIFGIIRILKDLIVDLLIRLLNEWSKKYIIAMTAFLILEKTKIWLEVLAEALACLPKFKNRVGYIDDVQYADIIPTQSIPDTNTGKCDI